MVGRADKKFGKSDVCFFENVCACAVADDAFHVKMIDGFFHLIAVYVNDDDIVSLVGEFLHKGSADCAQTADDYVHLIPLFRFVF